MHTQEIRRQFLNYFKKQGHVIVPSSPVLPHDDPTLLFTNAGMNQFKDVFLGQSKRDYTRATTSQKCIRAGGKHNDLDNVGHTSRHLTFFEMLGNFSFGDYFKEDAIKFAFELSVEVLKIDAERIYPTVFRDDDEAFELWKKYVPEKRITRLGEESNFWAMGDTGPCGPCSELLFDRGQEFGSATSPEFDHAGERFLEFWNLVFMQYNKLGNGQTVALPKPSIDTGAGLERVVALKMGVDSLFETDVLRGLISPVEVVSGKVYDVSDSHLSPAFRVIADHLRCLSFAIADGIQPSNVDRGYVLRKILRRAVRYGRMLGMEKPFLSQILPSLIDRMGQDYPELVKSESRIAEVLTVEEESFLRTLRRGGNMLQQIMESAASHGGKISGDEAFKLKDTYGFPVEEILLLAHDNQLTVDESRFNVLEAEAKERSKKAHKVTKQIAEKNIFEEFLTHHGKSEFIGYQSNKTEATLIGIVQDGEFVESVSKGQDALLILNRTPFYPEKGGQVADTGRLFSEGVQFDVINCEEPFNGVIIHSGTLQEGTLRVGMSLQAEIDGELRLKIANNHTATHLLHYALNKVLGEHVKQAGSVVDAERLRFDFSHHKALTDTEIDKIEEIVNERIRENRAVRAYEISYAEAQKNEGIKQFFGDKYGSKVRVIDIDFSKELCGGTHTSNTGNIGYFRIAKESSIAAGTRRIEAVTGKEAESLAKQPEQELQKIADLVKSTPSKLYERVEKLLQETKDLTSQIKEMKKGETGLKVDALYAKIEQGKGVPFVISEIESDGIDLKEVADSLLEKQTTLVVLLASKSEDKCQLLLRISDDLVARGLNAQAMMKVIAPIVGGGGGGKANSAQAGGKLPQKTAEALLKARELILAS